MSRVKKWSFLVIAVLAVLLLLMSSTDLIIKEETEEIKKISVFTMTGENSCMEDFKQGVLEAAGDSRVDANYMTAPAEESGKEMLARLNREYESGVQAIVLFTENTEQVRRYIKENGEKLPIITVNAFGSGDGLDDISFDTKTCAEELMEDIQRKHGKDSRVIFLTGDTELSAGIGEVMEQAFQERGMYAECRKLSRETVRDCKKTGKPTVFVGCWMTQTEQAMEELEGEILYGIGYSPDVLTGIKEGKVAGVEAFSMYAAGILAVRQAVSEIEQKKAETVCIPCRMITKENMKEQQEFLFPIY